MLKKIQEKKNNKNSTQINLIFYFYDLVQFNKKIWFQERKEINLWKECVRCYVIVLWKKI